MNEKALNIRSLLLFVLPLFLISCEDGIRFPWSGDKQHEAEVTADTTADEAADSSLVTEERDTASSLETDSLGSGEEAKPLDNSYSGESEAADLKQWRVVVSSMPSRELADKFIDRHNIEHADVLYVDRLDTYRVVYASFAELSDAQTEFSIIRSDYPDAWLVYF